MFGWGKKSDGFEWHKYVRTTIKLRREDRRKRIEEIKAQAVAKAKSAGQAGAAASQSALARLGHSFARIPGLVARGAGLLGRGLLSLAGGLSLHIGRFVTHAFGALLRPTSGFVSRPGIAPLIALVGVAAVASAVARWWTAGFDLHAVLSTGVGAVALTLAAAPYLTRLTGRSQSTDYEGQGNGLPVFSALSRRVALASLGAAFIVGSLAAAWAYLPQISLGGTGKSIAALSPFKTETLSGPARAITGDTLSVRGRFIKLVGIEAPELAQYCRNSRRRLWGCGRVARQRLARLVARRKVTCTVQDGTKADIQEGSCNVGDKDPALAMVKAGYAFAIGGLYARYGTAERAARNAKSGIWRGTAQRPADYRSNRWDQAKKRAPDGCPIKGHVSSKGKIYLVPWSPNYRRERVDRRRGERWFCSERDALAAGWRPDPAG